MAFLRHRRHRDLTRSCWTRLSLDQLAALSEGVCVAAQVRDAKSHGEDQRQAARVLFAPFAACLTVDERGNAAGHARMLPSLLNSLSPAAVAAGRKSLDEFEAGLKLACTPTRKFT